MRATYSPSIVNVLREISDKPEIVVLRLSCYDDIATSVTLKTTGMRGTDGQTTHEAAASCARRRSRMSFQR